MALVLESSRPAAKTSTANPSRRSSSSPPPPATTTVFNWGDYGYDTCVVEKSVFSRFCCCKSIFSCLGCCNFLPNCCEEQDKKYPPKDLFIVHPTKSGRYPVLLFFHGTSIKTSFYSQLFKHISSHGFIVVAPQVIKYLL